MNIQPASLPLSSLLQHAADAVRAVSEGRSLTEALARCPASARPGTQALAFQVMRYWGRAQAVRQLLAPKAPPPEAQALLISALALLCSPDDAGARYAPHTLVDQAVNAAKQVAPRHAAFINAVLRRCQREWASISQALDHDLVARFNHPRWWIQQLQNDWPQDWQTLLQANQAHPPMTLRVNARRGSTDHYLRRLEALGWHATMVGPWALQLGKPCQVHELPGFEQGEVSVQDLAAQWAAPLLIGPGLPKGARVLDACAAPGGKTAHLLELADLDVWALDSDAQRLQRVTQTLDRLGLNARTIAADARYPNTWWDGLPFDAILLDAPCSASGVVRRHPDARWLRRACDIPALASTQAQLLDALWPLLKPGGHLLYCTCSVFKAEGQAGIDAFLQRQPRAASLQDPPSPGHVLPRPDNRGDGDPLCPQASPDGFFYALLAKA